MKKFLRTITIIAVELCILGGCADVILKSRGTDLRTVATEVQNTIRVAFPAAASKFLALTHENLEPEITGSNLTFDTRFYPYYGMLNEREQSVYAQIYANAYRFSAAFSPVADVTTEEADNAMQAVIFDHPELFWIGNGYQCSYTVNNRCTMIVFEYAYSEDEIDQAKELFESRASYIINSAAGAGNTYDVEKVVHDMLLAGVTYNDVDLLVGQNAYGALVNGSSVCAGYSRAFQYIMTRLGVPTYYCIGSSNGDHAWNIICIDGGYYNVDVTWDDACDNPYEFFNRTDAEFSGTHSRTGLSLNLPACTATTWGGPTHVGTFEVPDLPRYSDQSMVQYIEITEEPQSAEPVFTPEPAGAQQLPEQFGPGGDSCAPAPPQSNPQTGPGPAEGGAPAPVF